MIRRSMTKPRRVHPQPGNRNLRQPYRPFSWLSTREYKPLKLVQKEKVNHDSAIYTFKLPADSDSAEIAPGKHVNVRAKIGGIEVTRPYTPISTADTKGKLELLVKTYPYGKMSRYIDSLHIGQTLDFSGPAGVFNIERNEIPNIKMVAGGSGITPMIQIARWCLGSQSDVTKLVLIYCNKTIEDILLKKELDTLAQNSAGRFNVFYTVDHLPRSKTAIDPAILETASAWPVLIETAIGQPRSGKEVLICGPSGFEDFVTNMLKSKHFAANDLFSFTQAQYQADVEEQTKSRQKVALKEYTLADVASHASHANGWLAIDGLVYDVTPFIEEHPGGDIISDGLGRDATELFASEHQHTDFAKNLLKQYQIGYLKK